MPYLSILLLLAQVQATFHSDVALVHVDVEVRQDSQAVEGLTKESFRVTDRGKPQTILYFGHQEELVDVVLLFDTRYEMRAATERVAEAAQVALSDLRQGDRVAVMAFGGNPGRCKTDLISDFGDDFDAARRGIANQVLHREFQQRTNSCSILGGLAGAAQQFLSQPNDHRRRAAIILTDDKGTPSRSGAVRDTVRDLWTADAVVLGVIVNSGAVVVYIGPPHRGVHYFAGQTGGDILNTGDAVEGLREMMHRLRSRYSLYYSLPPGKPGEERKIRVQLVRDAAKRYPRAVVRAKSGYVSPDDKQ